MARFPKFFYSNPKNPEASGPMIFHLNFPRCIFFIKDGYIDALQTQLIDKSADHAKVVMTCVEASRWFQEFIQQTEK